MKPASPPPRKRLLEAAPQGEQHAMALADISHVESALLQQRGQAWCERLTEGGTGALQMGIAALGAFLSLSGGGNTAVTLSAVGLAT
jgi:hypothetical protein